MKVAHLKFGGCYQACPNNVILNTPVDGQVSGHEFGDIELLTAGEMFEVH